MRAKTNNDKYSGAGKLRGCNKCVSERPDESTVPMVVKLLQFVWSGSSDPDLQTFRVKSQLMIPQRWMKREQKD